MVAGNSPNQWGGSGHPKCGSSCSSAYQASADGPPDLINHLLPSKLHNTPYPEIGVALSHWGDGHDQPLTLTPAFYLEKMWDWQRVEARAESLLTRTKDPKTRPHLLTVPPKETGAGWKTKPALSLGLRMDDESVCIVIGLRHVLIAERESPPASNPWPQLQV